MKIIFALLILIISWFLANLIIFAFAYRRAMSAGVYDIREGLAIGDDGKLVRTKTPIYFDEKTGAKFTGLTEVED